MKEQRDWKIINQRLVDRGRLSTYLKAAIQNHERDLRTVNEGKVGAPYEYSPMFIIAAFAIKSIDKKGYREAAGAVEDYLSLIGIEKHPNFRTLQWRFQQLEKSGIRFLLHQSIDEEEEVLDVIIDSTGEKSRKDGEYRSKMYDKLKEWKQLHIVISRKTRRILNIKVTKGNSGDPQEFIPLIKPIVERHRINRTFADGAYGSEENFEFCDKNNIDPFIPVHINAASGKHKRKRIEEQLGVIKKPGRYRQPTKEQKRKNQERWKDESGFHQRSLVECVIGVFKSVFDESVFSKTKDMIEKELVLKAVIYNKYIA